MVRQTLLVVALVLWLSLVSTAQPGSDRPWRFAVSGDSRNCGDVVMPGMAKSVLAHDAEFYWHLGDFRLGYDVDEDMRKLDAKLTIDDYHKMAWDDFITYQVGPFKTTAVHVGIGNHELYMHADTPAGQDVSHAEFVGKFSKWLDGSKTAYYHWKSHEVDFISMDNSGNAGFEDGQLAWLEQRLEQDRSDPAVKSVVVGMHRALPNSLACGHSMNGDRSASDADNLKSLQSGRRAYQDLWEFQNSTPKHVYVLASHSHFYMQDIFNTTYWQHHAETGGNIPNNARQDKLTHLEGWLIGTAGAKRYRLPDQLPPDTKAITYAYGYLLGDVHKDGSIEFRFEQVVADDVPRDVSDKYGDLVDYCFLANRDETAHPPVASCSEQ